MSEIRQVNVLGVPHTMQIVDGSVLFSDKSGFGGVTGRFLFAYRCGLWYLETAEDTFGRIAACHVRRMHDLIKEHIGGDHELGDYAPGLKWKSASPHPTDTGEQA